MRTASFRLIPRTIRRRPNLDERRYWPELRLSCLTVPCTKVDCREGDCWRTFERYTARLWLIVGPESSSVRKLLPSLSRHLQHRWLCNQQFAVAAERGHCGSHAGKSTEGNFAPPLNFSREMPCPAEALCCHITERLASKTRECAMNCVSQPAGTSCLRRVWVR